MKNRIIAIILALLVCVSVAVPAYAAADTYGAADEVITIGAIEAEIPRLLDLADLLTDAEEKSLTEKMDKVGKEFEVELAIVTVDSIGEMTKADYAKKVYTESKFGFGEDKDGVLLLINMDTPNDGENRGWHIYTKGLGYDAISSDQSDEISEAMSSDLKAGNYADACDIFITECESCLDSYVNFDWVMSLIISVVVGFLIALIATSIMKGQLKSVRFKAGAADYVKPGSLNVTVSRDFFLYRKVERREKPKSSEKSSGSGSREGGSGGSF